MEGVEGSVDVYRGVAAGQALFGALFGFAGALDVDFRGTFGGLCEDRDFIRQDFRKSPCDGQAQLAGVFAVDDFADGKFRDQRGMPGKDAEIPILRRGSGLPRPPCRRLSFPA